MRIFTTLFLSVFCGHFLFAQTEVTDLTLGVVEKTRIKKTVEDYCEEMANFGQGSDESLVTLYDMFITPSQLVYDDIGLYNREENIEISRYLTRIKRKYPGQITFRCYTKADNLKYYVMMLLERKVAVVPVNKSVRGAGFNFNRDVYMVIDPKNGKIMNILKDLHEDAKLVDEPTSSVAADLEEEPKTPTPKSDDFPYEMVFVKGGKFRMGNEYGDQKEKPVHPVTVRDFYIGMYEVTQEMYQKVMGANPSRFQGCANCPVEKVSWHDAQSFIKKLNEMTGLKYRLPTEAEWEYAAKGGAKITQTRYAGSDDANEVGWYKDNSAFKTKPIGGKRPNELSIFDMSGNVSEWVEDWYEPYTLDEKENPTGPINGESKVFRGGCYGNSDMQTTVTTRAFAPPETSGSMVGIRLAMDVNK